MVAVLPVLASLTPEEIAVILSLVQAAMQAAENIADAVKAQQLADLEAKLLAQLDQQKSDRAKVNANIDTRDKKIEDELK